MTPERSRALLGLGPGADKEEVRRAYLLLARQNHPDAGGNHEVMTLLNDAYEVLMAQPTHVSAARRATRVSRIERDIASFTIDALPVVAFENLLLVAGILGDVADEEPPYLLEFVLRDGGELWVRCDIVPEAGSSMVSVTTYNRGPGAAPGVEQVRDLLVQELNSLGPLDVP